MKRILLPAITALLLSIHAPAFAQGTAFTYQGRLNNNGSAASGSYDFRFKLYVDPLGNTQVGNSYLTNGVAVTNGLFLTTIDFGPGIFIGNTNWLEVDVRTNGAGSYTVLNPLQNLTPTPYAIFAETASNLNGTLPAGQLSGTILNSSLPASPNFSGAVTAGSFAGNGASLTGVNATALNGLGSGSFWQTGGNTGTTNGNFLGTRDNQPVELWVDGQRAFRLEMNANGEPNVIGGSTNNSIMAGVTGSSIGGGFYNKIFGDFRYYGGSTIAGGYDNQIYTNASDSVIGGGFNNQIDGDSDDVGSSVISGGIENEIATNAFGSVIGGGEENMAGGEFSTVPGGYDNLASGAESFAAGYNAQATNTGAFVWSDGNGTLTTSAANNSVTFRASGGYRFFTGTGSGGASLAAGATSWTTISDRNAKKNFEPVDTVAVLDKLATIPIQQWNYKWERNDDVPNIGPMAQDFKHAFYPGRDDKGISTLEFDGVELAAIQGLNQKLEEQKTENEELKKENQSLEKRLDELATIVQSLAEKK